MGEEKGEWGGGSDHMNQLGALQCSECNSNDYENW